MQFKKKSQRGLKYFYMLEAYDYNLNYVVINSIFTLK